jgi:peptidyl-prolyl cis-trans isomerase C
MLLALSLPACKKSQEGTSATPSAGKKSSEADGVPLAKIDDVTITLGEFQERINSQSPYIRARFNSPEQKKEFLENLVRFEVLAKEAQRKGLDKDPDVVRTMKQVMIQKLMKDVFENRIKPEDIKEAEMQAFYKEHESEYNKPEEVRASAVVLSKKADADKVAREARTETSLDNKLFRELVQKYSIDNETKLRGGDLRYFGRNTADVPREVVDAVFALKKTGEVAGPVAVGDKFYVVKLTGRREAMTKSYDEVKRQIQNRLYREKRTQSQKDYIEELKKKAKITLHEDNLAKVKIDTSMDSAAGMNPFGGMPPAMAPMGGPGGGPGGLPMGAPGPGGPPMGAPGPGGPPPAPH